MKARTVDCPLCDGTGELGLETPREGYRLVPCQCLPETPDESAIERVKAMIDAGSMTDEIAAFINECWSEEVNEMLADYDASGHEPIDYPVLRKADV